MLELKGTSVVANPAVIGVQSGDIVEFKSKDGKPRIKYEPSGAVKLDSKEGSERITVLQAPFEFYCSLIVKGETYTYGPKGGGIGITDPPFVTGSDTPNLGAGSPATVVTLSGTDFYSGSIGLVNGSPRETQVVSNTSVKITVTAADLAKPGTLQLAVKNVTASNSVPLTVT